MDNRKLIYYIDDTIIPSAVYHCMIKNVLVVLHQMKKRGNETIPDEGTTKIEIMGKKLEDL